MGRRIGLVGVPSSAGAHWPGQEKASRAMRDAGIVERLKATGKEVADHGDRPHVRFRPDPEHRDRQNLSRVISVASGLAKEVEGIFRSGEIPLVLGGDCTIGLGVLAGVARLAREDPTLRDVALLYFDGHVDLNTPATSRSGILDSMGVAHMIGEERIAEELGRLGSRFPLLSEERIVYFGYKPLEMNEAEGEVLGRRTMPRHPVEQVRGRAEDAATEALAEVEGVASGFLVHFDVDAIDFADFPPWPTSRSCGAG